MSRSEKLRRIIVWFRNDLRLHDNEAFASACTLADQVIPVYVFDKRLFQQTRWFDFPKTGSHRAKFLLESVSDLRSSLRQRGSDLVIAFGKPEELIADLCKRFNAVNVFCQKEVCSEETEVEAGLERRCSAQVKYFKGSTLIHEDDLPFNIQSALPEIFTSFRKIVETRCPVRPPLPAPLKVPPLPALDEEGNALVAGDLPSLQQLQGTADSPPSPPPSNSSIPDMVFTGGETKALERVKYYLWDKDLIRAYKETRNESLGGDYSSKFAPWFANGCLSARYVYAQVKQYEQQRVENDSTYWLIFELLWRDYFRFLGIKHGNRLFFNTGIRGAFYDWKEDVGTLQRWIDGKTGYPFVDANMRELKCTGFMSNRGRQNVASYLTKDLGINWQMGAEWFESVLLDYDPCSNWGNWQYVSGVGNDPREDRRFNIAKQAKTYDPNGDYVRRWVPELRGIPDLRVHEPWLLSQEEQRRFECQIGVDYPQPMTHPLPYGPPRGGQFQKHQGPKYQRRGR